MLIISFWSHNIYILYALTLKSSVCQMEKEFEDFILKFPEWIILVWLYLDKKDETVGARKRQSIERTRHGGASKRMVPPSGGGGGGETKIHWAHLVSCE